jgi:hypothetical protein
MSANPLGRPLALVPVVLALLACGGGGGGSGSKPDFTLSFTPSRLTARYFHNQRYQQNTYTQAVSATVTGAIEPLPSATLYVVMVEDAPVFVGNPAVSLLGGNAFSLTVAPDLSLADGAHSGNLTIQMFQDAALTKPYVVAGGTLPYTITVDPELTVTVKIDGVAASAVFSSSNTAVTDINGSTVYWSPTQPAAAFTVAPGKLIELQASVPVTWHSPDQFYPYGSLWSAPTVTATTLTQTIASPPSGTSGMTGNVYVAVPTAAGQFGAGLIVDIQQ